MKTLPTIIITSLWFATSFVASGQLTELKLKTITKSENGHSFVLKLSKKPFHKEQHDLTKIKDNIIDGREVFGIDGSIPREEFSTFSLLIDDITISIPTEIFDRFYDPDFGYEASYKYVDAFWGNKYDCVFVFMNGSDGAGAYSVCWILRKNGQHAFSLIPTYEMDFQFNDRQ